MAAGAEEGAEAAAGKRNMLSLSGSYGERSSYPYDGERATSGISGGRRLPAGTGAVPAGTGAVLSEEGEVATHAPGPRGDVVPGSIEEDEEDERATQGSWLVSGAVMPGRIASSASARATHLVEPDEVMHAGPTYAAPLTPRLGDSGMWRVASGDR